MKFEDLPAEIIANVAVFLAPSDLALASRTCRSFYRAFTPALWRSLHFANAKQETFESLVLPLFTDRTTPGDVIEPGVVKPDSWAADPFQIDNTDTNLNMVAKLVTALESGYVSEFALSSVHSLALDLFHIYPESWYCTGVKSIISFYSPRSGSRLGATGKGSLPGLSNGPQMALSFTPPSSPVKEKYDSCINKILSFLTPDRLAALFPNLSVLKISNPVAPAAQSLAHSVCDFADQRLPMLSLDWTYPLPPQISRHLGSVQRLTVKYCDPTDMAFRDQLSGMVNLESLGIHFQAQNAAPASDNQPHAVSDEKSLARLTLQNLTQLTKLSIAVDGINPLLYTDSLPESVEFLELSGKPDYNVNLQFSQSLRDLQFPGIKTLHLNMAPLFLNPESCPRFPFCNLTELVVTEPLGPGVDVLFIKHNPNLRRACFRSGLSLDGLKALSETCTSLQSLSLDQARDAHASFSLLHPTGPKPNAPTLLAHLLSKLHDLRYLHFSCTSPLTEFDQVQRELQHTRAAGYCPRLPTVFCTVTHNRSDFSKQGQLLFAQSVESSKQLILKTYKDSVKFICASRLPGHSVGVTFSIQACA